MSHTFTVYDVTRNNNTTRKAFMDMDRIAQDDMPHWTKFICEYKLDDASVSAYGEPALCKRMAEASYSDMK